MLIGLGLADVGFELGADLIEELVQTASDTTVGRGDIPHAPMARVHRHDASDRNPLLLSLLLKMVAGAQSRRAMRDEMAMSGAWAERQRGRVGDDGNFSQSTAGAQRFSLPARVKAKTREAG
jgi:hypothetical protein